MKNLLYKKGLSEKFAEAIGNIVKEIIIIFIGIFVLIGKLLYRFRKFEYRLGLFVAVITFLFSSFTRFVESPKVILGYYREPSINENVLERDQVISLIHKIWGKDAPVGLLIAKCESGYRPNAKNQNTNGTTDQGVFQANTIHGMPDMYNPTANILYAYKLYKEQGTNPWNSSHKCWDN